MGGCPHLKQLVCLKNSPGNLIVALKQMPWGCPIQGHCDREGPGKRRAKAQVCQPELRDTVSTLSYHPRDKSLMWNRPDYQRTSNILMGLLESSSKTRNKIHINNLTRCSVYNLELKGKAVITFFPNGGDSTPLEGTWRCVGTYQVVSITEGFFI